MIYYFDTKSRSVMFEVSIYTSKPQRIRFKSYPCNANHTPFPATTYLNRFCTIYGKDRILIKCPVTSDITAVEIYNDAIGNKGGHIEDKSFVVKNIEKKLLPTSLFMFDFSDPVMSKFVTFAENFSAKCGYMSPGIIYSPDALFRIDFKEGALTTPDGVSTTPARIGSKSAIVEVSKSKFDTVTTAGRFVVLCHEFSHFYKNKNMRNEEEADFYSVNIALGKGYPEVEILIAYTEIFENADTPGNRQRYDKIKQYVDNFSGTVKRTKQKLEKSL